ncbi:hypothetical protein D5086_033981 [Populus alba]|uniref:Uncharacterized protein n=1 Tax=Populus alba TaxID=43335 RepID=A0ACC4ADS0_POPAL
MPRTQRVQSVRPLRKDVVLEQVAEAYMLKEGDPEIQRQLIFATGVSKSEWPLKLSSKAFTPFEEGSVGETSSRSIHAQEGYHKIQRQYFRNRWHRSRECPRNSTSQSVRALCGKGVVVDNKQLAEAYMLKRDDSKFKAI